MNIDKIQSYQATKLNLQRKTNNAMTNVDNSNRQVADTVSFTGLANTKMRNRLVAGATAAFMAITSFFGFMPSAKAAARKNIEDYSLGGF